MQKRLNVVHGKARQDAMAQNVKTRLKMRQGVIYDQRDEMEKSQSKGTQHKSTILGSTQRGKGGTSKNSDTPSADERIAGVCKEEKVTEEEHQVKLRNATKHKATELSVRS